jgi:hypothetical protein
MRQMRSDILTESIFNTFYHEAYICTHAHMGIFVYVYKYIRLKITDLFFTLIVSF